MDAIATRGHVILDDTQVRLRTSGTAQRFTELFALKADSSTVSKHGLGGTAHSKPGDLRNSSSY